MQKIAIIGAGNTGLTIANELSALAQVDVTVFDKSRGLGGRMATRRVDDFHFDHGAQYFVAKSPEFKRFLQAPLAAGAIAQWDANFVELDGSATEQQRHQQRLWGDDFPHYVGVPTMSALARFMSQGLTISGSVQVAAIHEDNKSRNSNTDKLWRLFSNENDDLGVFDWVICTCPVEQTLLLLPKEFSHFKQLEKINMQACFAVMLGYEQQIDLSFQAALVRNSDISWFALNSHKPGRPDKCAILIQSSNEWAQAHVEDDKSVVQTHLIQETEKVLGLSLSNFEYASTHRWLYANTEKQKDKIGDVFFDADKQLAAAGDWCGNARVESAYLHGLKLAQQIKTTLKE